MNKKSILKRNEKEIKKGLKMRVGVTCLHRLGKFGFQTISVKMKKYIFSFLMSDIVQKVYHN